MSSGIPVTDEIQGNLNIRDFSGTGLHGNLLVEQNLTVGGSETLTGNLTVGGTVRGPGIVSRLVPSGDTTGATDVTNLNAALTAAGRGGTVEMAPGVWNVNTGITIPQGVFLIGPQGGYRAMDQDKVRIEPTAGFTGTTYVFTFTQTNPAGAILNIVIDGTHIKSLGGGIDGIQLNGDADVVSIIGCHIKNMSGHGIDKVAGTIDGMYIRECYLQANIGDGYHDNYAVDGHLLECHADANGGHGFWFSNFNNMEVVACKAQNNLTGFRLQRTGTSVTMGGGFIGCSTTSNQQGGFVADNGSGGPMAGGGYIQYIGCRTLDDAHAGAGFAGFDLNLGGSIDLVLDGCATGATSATANPDYGLNLRAWAGSVVISGNRWMGGVAAVSIGAGSTTIKWGTGNSFAVGNSASNVITTAAYLAALDGGSLALSAGTAALGGLLSVTNTTSSPAASPVCLFGVNGTDNLFATRVTGDTQSRLKIDPNGKHLWGSGSAGGDTSLYRSAAGTIKTDNALVVGGAFTSQAASKSVTHGNPAPTASTTLIMGGFGSTWTFTPGSSGKTLVTVCGNVRTNTAAVQLLIGARFGTGTVPSQGDAVTGTAIGSDQNIRPGATSGAGAGWQVTAVLSLVAGTAYWFDIAYDTSNAADTCQPQDSQISLVEVQ